MVSLDPDASVIAVLMSERLADREVIRQQQEQLIALMAILKAQERSVHLLTHLVSDLLAREQHG